MCGIAGIYLKDPSIVDTENDQLQFDRMIDELLLGIESRGRDATGFVAVNGMTVQMDKKDVKASDFIKTRRRAWMKKGTRMVLAHTRLATQGHQSQNENNHPVMHGTTFVTHNGHIHNDAKVFSDLQLDRYAEVDSVAIAAALDHYGFDNAKAALEKLRGAFAIAAVNPVHNQDTLLLAKGPSYPPLHYFENKHMVMWASESTVIRKAFEKILGTAPEYPKIGYLSEGDAIWIRDGELELQKGFFTPPSTYNSTGNSSNSWNWWEGRDDEDTATVRTYRSSRGVTTILDLKSTIKALRDSGGGRAITFENKSKMTDEQRKLHNNKWVVCLHCNGTVADMCTVTHSKWGDICWDCLTEAMLRESKKGNGSLTKGAEWAELSHDDFEQLEEYADIDLETVEKCVETMADELGISYRTIFWLLFCSEFVNMGYGTEQLRERLHEVYLATESRLFESRLADDIEADIDACAVVDQIIPASRQLAAGDKPKDEIPQVLGKCDHCRKKAKFYYNGLRWCNRHLETCMTRACKDEPVSYGPDGKRWCHKHSRGVKKLVYLEKATA